MSLLPATTLSGVAFTEGHGGSTGSACRCRYWNDLESHRPHRGSACRERSDHPAGNHQESRLEGVSGLQEGQPLAHMANRAVKSNDVAARRHKRLAARCAGRAGVHSKGSERCGSGIRGWNWRV